MNAEDLRGRFVLCKAGRNALHNTATELADDQPAKVATDEI